jgi:nanoRNase/pAp phosphatase (c-di-AMP/oligoRNAs hydrolase)
MKTLENERVIFFHEGTLNGKAGAYAAWKIYGQKATYEGLDYSTLDMLSKYDLTGKTVYLIGLSIATKNIAHCVYNADKVVFIDHHESTKNIKDELGTANADKLEVIHSTTRASCCIAWSYFIDDMPVPPLYLAIEDMEIRPTNPHTPNAYYICTALSIHFDFASLTSYFQSNLEKVKDTDTTARLINDGHHYYKLMESLVGSYVNKAEYYEILDTQVPILNIPKTFTTPCLTHLAKKAGFAMSYVDCGNKRYWSLRSTDQSNLDSGKIAAILEGGGSTHVGGFVTSISVLPSDLNQLLKKALSENVNRDTIKIRS